MDVWGPCLESKRKDHKLTQKQVAKKVGVNTNTIANWERGRNTERFTFYIMIFISLCQLFTFPLDDLMLDDESCNLENERTRFGYKSSGILQNHVKFLIKKIFNEELNNQKFAKMFDNQFDRCLISNLEKNKAPWKKIVEVIKLCQCLKLTDQDLMEYYEAHKTTKQTTLEKCQNLLGTNQTKRSKSKHRSNIESDTIDIESVQNHLEG